jgi:hypothetical protein
MTFPIPCTAPVDWVKDGRTLFFISKQQGDVVAVPADLVCVQIAIPPSRGIGVAFVNGADKRLLCAIRFFGFN